MDETVIERLGELGLTGYEGRAYLALVGREAGTASEVARLAGLPRQRVYDVLESLLEKGLVTARPGRVIKYRAVAPDEAVGRLVAAQQQRLRHLEASGAGIVAALAPLFHSGRQNSNPLDYIEVLREPGAIATRFDQLQAQVRREILVFNRPPYATVPQENVAGLTLARQGMARGLYEFSLFDDPAAAAGVYHFIEEGEQARFVPELPLKLVIIDEEIVMFGMEDRIASQNDLTIMVVEHPALASVLKTAFDAYWARGVSYEEAKGTATERVS